MPGTAFPIDAREINQDDSRWGDHLSELAQKVATVQSRPADSVAIVSGGLDSTTLVYDMLDQGYTPHLLSFNYGQRHFKELKYANVTARQLGLRHDIVDLTGLTHLISNSALTSGLAKKDFKDENDFEPIIEVPDGHYAEENMKVTVVPNRNMIMISIAAGVAVNNKYRTIGLGVHGGDHFIYPDCRPAFLDYTAHAIWYGNEGFHDLDRELGPIYAPFLNRTKADIAYRAIDLGVPLHMTWSCYKGGDKHCGRCGTCVERLEAINEGLEKWNHINRPVGDPFKTDNTEYADDEYWRTVVNK